MKKVLFTINQNNLFESVLLKTSFTRGEALFKTFEDKEIFVKVQTEVFKKDIVIIQSVYSLNEDLYKVLLLVDSLKQSGAGTITWVIPYLGYSRQGISLEGEAISARVMAKIIDSAHVDKLVVFDVHNIESLKYFSTHVENIYPTKAFADYIRNNYKDMLKDRKNLCVISPDAGAVNRALAIKEELGISSFYVASKHRNEADSIDVINLDADLKGKTCILVDDIISTGLTVMNNAIKLNELGAKNIISVVTHPVISNHCTEHLKSIPNLDVIVSNTIEKEIPNYYQIVDISNLICEVIK